MILAGSGRLVAWEMESELSGSRVERACLVAFAAATSASASVFSSLAREEVCFLCFPRVVIRFVRLRIRFVRLLDPEGVEGVEGLGPGGFASIFKQTTMEDGFYHV